MSEVNGTRWSALIAMPLITAVIIGCGGAEDGQETAMEEAEPAAEEEMAMPVDEATAATITGMVAFEGTDPEPISIDMAEEPACAEKHEGQPMYDPVVVNENGSLRWVFVYVKEGQLEDGRSLSDLAFPTPTQAVRLDQDGCRYEPHVFGVHPGQTIEILNSDGVLHNINAQADSAGSFNISQPGPVKSRTAEFDRPEIMVSIECDVHGWMQSYAGVLPHPYFDTTGETGQFTLDMLPPGTYTVEAWHEEYGTQTQTVTVGANETAEISFTFSSPSA